MQSRSLLSVVHTKCCCKLIVTPLNPFLNLKQGYAGPFGGVHYFSVWDSTCMLKTVMKMLPLKTDHCLIHMKQKKSKLFCSVLLNISVLTRESKQQSNFSPCESMNCCQLQWCFCLWPSTHHEREKAPKWALTIAQILSGVFKAIMGTGHPNSLQVSRIWLREFLSQLWKTAVTFKNIQSHLTSIRGLEDTISYTDLC